MRYKTEPSGAAPTENQSRIYKLGAVVFDRETCRRLITIGPHFDGHSHGLSSRPQCCSDLYLTTEIYVTFRRETVSGFDEWLPIYADDGISDSPKERYTIEIPVKNSGEYAVTIRVFDVNRNSGNSRFIIKK